MLPSRGVFRCLQMLRLQPPKSPLASRLAGSSRQFGTALRTNGDGSHSTRAQGLAAPSLLSGRGSRIMAGGSLAASGLWSAHRQTLQSRSPFSQVRHASTQPAMAGSSNTAEAAAGNGTLDTADTLSNVTSSFDGSSLLDMVPHIGYLKELGLSYGYGATSTVQWIVEHIQVGLGLPWWATIATFCVLTRAALFFPSLIASQHSHIMNQLKQNPKFASAQAKMTASWKSAGSPAGKAEAMRARAEMQSMQRAAGFKMSRTLLPLFQIPLGFGMFRLLRGVATLPVPSYEVGGVLWFTDLSVADPFFILPVIGSGIMYYVMRLNIPYMDKSQQDLMKLMGYGLPVISLVATFNLNAGLQFFFILTSFLQALQSYVFYRPWLRRLAGLPELGPPAAGPVPVHGTGTGTGPGATWQPPRVIQARATVHDTPAGEATRGGKSPIADIKSTIGGLRSKLNNYTEKGRVKQTWDKAQNYEEKRRMEEKQRYYDRVERARRAKRTKGDE